MPRHQWFFYLCGLVFALQNNNVSNGWSINNNNFFVFNHHIRGRTTTVTAPLRGTSTNTTGIASSSSSTSSFPPVTHPTFELEPLEVATALSSAAPTSETEQALASLAATILALLAGDDEAAQALIGHQKQQLIEHIFQAYKNNNVGEELEINGDGRLSVPKARALFVDLARNMVMDLATPSQNRTNTQQLASYRPSPNKSAVPGAARAHAKRVLAMDESGNTIERIATKLLLMADKDGDGRVSLLELANLFDTVYSANVVGKQKHPQVETFPQPLRALAGSLQLLPAIEGQVVTEAASRAIQWNIGVPGDDHTLRRVELEKGKLSIVGLGRSADASAYFLPELGLCFDAGIHVKSIQPKTILLSHAHRDHIAALPTHAAAKAIIICPNRIHGLVRRFLLAEAQLNYGDETQSDEETIAALGDFDVQGVEDGDEFLLPKKAYQGSPTPIGVQVFRAPHKEGVPAVSYGLYRSKTRLKPEYTALPKSELGKLIQNDIQITESYNEGLLFYTGDTTINLLKERWREILPKYKHIIHEVTFLGKPSTELDKAAQKKGHTHYSQLHPWICAFPETTFVCVHWSLRYSREDVLQYFEDEYGGVPKNVVLWV